MDEELKEQLETQFTMLYEIMAHPKLAETIAKMMRNIVDNLMKVGFNEEQAIQIAINFNNKIK